MELNSVGKVILGLLSSEDRSGYDIKLAVDKSTRFFWAASYGQIYPELKRLEEEGLIEGTASPQGGRPRTVYRITEKGKGALTTWIMDTDPTVELRHEGLLKLVFAEALESEEDRIAVLEEIATVHRRQVIKLEALEDGIRSCGGMNGRETQPGTREFILRFGLDYHRWIVSWFEQEIENALEADRPSEGSHV